MKFAATHSKAKVRTSGTARQRDHATPSNPPLASRMDAATSPDTQGEPGMRERIKAVATDLLIQRGYRGASFGDIAEALSTTRANIHYHFGNKNALIEEVIEDYVSATLARFHAVWTNNDSSLAEKIDATIAFNRERYARFNSPTDNGHPWSLIARMRGDSDSLSPRSIAALRRFASELGTAVTIGVAGAVSRGELSSATPIGDVVVHIAAIVNSAGPITQDAQSFDRLEQLYRVFLNTTMAAYGAAARGPAPGAATRAVIRRATSL
jgi:TetR/AcrR family transcriptional regulator, transcriptional repressor for nem operon